MAALTVIKTLPRAWSVGGKTVREIEVREPLVGDMTEAEKEGNPSFNPTAFQVALACQTMVRAGDYTGPFTPGHFAKMPVANWQVVRSALIEAEDLGEDTQPGQVQPS